jgi:DNA-binding SARP family transcriptional activator
MSSEGGPMSDLNVSLFGKFRMWYGDQSLAGLEGRKVQELFCYLLLYRSKPHPRETLADLLWGDHLTAQSKKYLRQTLWQLQAALESQAELSSQRPLLVEPEWIQLNPAIDLWFDVALFEQAFSSVQSLPGQALSAQGVQILQEASKLYQGDLLEGWYQDWCLYERERLQNMYLAILDKLMEYCEAHHDYEAGLTYGARILWYDHARERTHRRLMRLHYLAGDRTAALRQYERCMTTLAKELSVKPAQRTVVLYEQIQADRLDPSLFSAEANVILEATSVPLADLLDHLRQLQVVLTKAQHQVWQEIQAVERALKGRR